MYCLILLNTTQPYNSTTSERFQNLMVKSNKEADKIDTPNKHMHDRSQSAGLS